MAHYILFIFFSKISALRGDCITAEILAVSVRLTWCQRLAEFYNQASMHAKISLQKDGVQRIIPVNFQALEATISGLRARTKYLLSFNIYSHDLDNRETLVAMVMTERFHTNNYCKLPVSSYSVCSSRLLFC